MLENKNKETILHYHPHPILPAVGREEHRIVSKNSTLADILNEFPDKTNRLDVIAYVNDRLISRSDWNKVIIKEGDHIILKQSVHGNDSNPLQVILSVVVLVASVALFGPGGLATASWGWTGTQAALAGAAFMVAGSLIITALFPPETPKGMKNDPNYNISGTSNRARPYEPLTLVVGTTKLFPDLGAKPFLEQSREDAYLSQIFNYGFGDLVIANTKIGETDIDEYQEVAYQWSDANGVCTLFPGNVDSVEGGALKYEDGWVTRTTPINTSRIGVDINGTLFATNDKGGFEYNQVSVEIQYAPAGSNAWVSFNGTANVANSTTTTILGRFMRAIVAGGTVTSNNGVFVIGNGTAKPVRWSAHQAVNPGQYDVRVRRLTEEFTSTKKQADLTWSQMRCFQPDDSDYRNQTRLAVRIRSSGQLNGTIQALNSIVSARIPTWNGSAWVTTTSSNPAYIFLYIARGARDSNNKRLWGACLPDSRIDIESIKAWGAWCAAKGLECNYAFQSSVSIAEMLTLVARCGRASMSWHKGVLGVVWDQENLPITQVFGMGNILAGSYSINYMTKNLADEIIVKFKNKDLDYQDDEVRVTVTGVTVPSNPVELEILGVTSAAQAAKEANLIAARQFYNRRRIAFETDIEGLACSRGDVISLSHDLTAHGQSGRLVNGNTTHLTLDREVTFNSSNTAYIGIRQPSGTYTVHQVVNPYTGNTINTSSVTLSSPLSFNPSTDVENDPRDYIFTFDFKATPGVRLKIVNIVPSQDNRVQIVAIDDVPAYYTSESANTTYVAPSLINESKARVYNVNVTEQYQGYGLPLKIYLDWDLEQARGARVSVRQNNGKWVEYGEIQGGLFELDLVSWKNGDQLDFELVPIEVIQSKQTTKTTSVSYFIKGLPGVVDNNYINLPTISGLELFDSGNGTEFTGRDAVFVWRKVAAAREEIGSETLGAESGTLDDFFQDYEVRIYNTNGTLRRTEHTTAESYIYTYEKNVEDGLGVPVREFRIAVYYRSKTNQIGAPATLQVNNPAPSAPTGVRVSTVLKNLYVQTDRPQDTDFQGTEVHLGASSGFTPNATTLIYSGPDVAITLTPNVNYGSTYYIKCGHFDGFSNTAVNYSTANTITPTQITDADAQIEINSRASLINVDDWVDPVTDPMGGWDHYGGTLANTTVNVAGTGPFNSAAPLMTIRGSENAPGWYSIWRHWFDVNPNRAYVAFVWVKKRSVNTTAGLYIGWTNAAGYVAEMNGTDNPNAYFVANRGSAMTNDKWYLAVGVLQAANATTSTGLSGLYDPDTGTILHAGSDYKHHSASEVNQFLRFGFYSTGTSFTSDDGFVFAAPSIYIMDGSEPSIEALLRRSYQQGQLAKLDMVGSDQIAANSVIASKIFVANLSSIKADMGSLTAGTIALDTTGWIRSGQSGYNTGSPGFWLGKDGATTKLSIGNPSGRRLTWDGTGLALVGNVQSTNYSTGSAGWRILDNGDAEFNDVTVRGDYLANTGMKFEITPDDPTFLIYAGPAGSLKSQANAVFYILKDGNAYFGGSLSAGVLKNSVTGTQVSSTANVILGPFGTNGGSKTVVWSYYYDTSWSWWDVGEDPSPFVNPPTATLKLERRIGGGSWTELQTANVTGYTDYSPAMGGDPGFYQAGMSGAWTYTDTNASTSNFEYRVSITSRNVTSVFNQTQRISITSTEE